MRYPFIALICISAVWCSCTEAPAPTPWKTGMEGKPLPSFAIQLLDSTSFIHSEDLPKGKNLVLFYFKPNCPYCRAQMRDMVNNIERFKDKELCILTREGDLKSTNEFARYFKLNGLNNVIVGRDTGSVVAKTYRIMAVPFTAYFDKNKQLKVAYISRMSQNSLFKF
ncbi:MAG TPA: redoxin domain-containing protein [Niastella sp.]